MSHQALSFPRFKICKSKYPGVGWLIILRITETNNILIGRAPLGVNALSSLESGFWQHEAAPLLEAHGLGLNGRK